ncbi:MAG TPA: choice-of-anchor tandem repeat GloVer-containing protein, partial [Verrucomicrobiae bacterium]|nr:choice-of-anchor tandem repeat GloVer-containing protein [Verrucomicrobiae bacterium]
MRPNSIRLVAGLFLIGFLTSSAGQTNYQRLRSFGFAEALGASPRTAPIEASDGRLYGTTFLGRASVEDDGGGIFRVNKDGTGYRLLHQFNADQEDVRNLPAPILEGTDGVLYGVTAFGGSNDLGTVFKLNKDGSGFAVLHNFTGTNGDGETPQGAITEAHDGALYGTTLRGGEGGGGVVFRINRNGTDYRVLNAFSLAGTNGYSPKGRVVDGSDGALYGTSAFGGSQGAGTVFRLSFDGSALAILHSFLGTDGRFPLEIVEASDGSLYGVAADGGSHDEGTIFKVAKDGSNFKVLHNFGDTPNDAASLYAGVVEGSDGALYGASYEGGFTFMGTIFRITKDGADYRILRSFSEEDGDCPYAGLANGSGGTLYGATPEGGDREDGTLFRINNDGSDYTVVHNFAFVRGDGSRPRGDLVEATDGALYGTTVLGGSHEWGTVFKMNKDASGYAVLVNFSGFGDGQNPQGRLLEASDGQLYGTTAGGGSNGGGIVFKVKKDGTDFSKLYEFTGYAVWNRFPGLVEGSDGALYGTAGFDGANYPQGTVYRLAKDGSQYSVIHRFTGANGDGAAPQASLLRATDGS